MDFKQSASNYLQRLKKVMDGFDLKAFDNIIQLILGAYSAESHIFIMGNGGSGATASHLACDINKGCCFDLDKKFKMICLNDNMPTMLALANDISYEAIFEEQIKNFFKPDDLVIGISGSGNSENVLRAIRYSSENGGKTIGWSGFDGGKLAAMVDSAFIVPSNDMQQVEDAHMVVAHMVMQSVYSALHQNSAPTGCTPD